nr:hypothetical protein [Desulfobulbaceae bacterium]
MTTSASARPRSLSDLHLVQTREKGKGVVQGRRRPGVPQGLIVMKGILHPGQDISDDVVTQPFKLVKFNILFKF